MRIVKPKTFTTDLLVYSSATELYPAWVSGTTYHKDDIVVYIGYENAIQTYRRWKCIVGNTTATPTSSNTDWLDIGPCNKCAMFDSQVSTQTSSVGDLSVTVKIGSVTSLALLNITGGATVNVVIKDNLNGNTIYTFNKSLNGDNPIDWYGYFFYDEDAQLTTALFEFPQLPVNAHAYITLHTTGTVLVGYCLFGKSVTIGTTEYGLKTGIIDYSRKDTDEFGTTTFTERAFSKRMSGTVFVNNYDIGRVSRALYGVRATPTLYIATDDIQYEEIAVVMGFYRDFNIEVQYPTASLCSLEIEGLV